MTSRATPSRRPQDRGKRLRYACGRWKKATYRLRIYRGRGNASKNYVNFTMPGRVSGSVRLSDIPVLTGLILNGK